MRRIGVISHTPFNVEVARDNYPQGWASALPHHPADEAAAGRSDARAARTRCAPELGFAADDFVVCTFGHITWTKSGDVLLDAFARVAAPATIRREAGLRRGAGARRLRSRAGPGDRGKRAARPGSGDRLRRRIGLRGTPGRRRPRRAVAHANARRHVWGDARLPGARCAGHRQRGGQLRRLSRRRHSPYRRARRRSRTGGALRELRTNRHARAALCGARSRARGARARSGSDRRRIRRSDHDISRREPRGLAGHDRASRRCQSARRTIVGTPPANVRRRCWTACSQTPRSRARASWSTSRTSPS